MHDALRGPASHEAGPRVAGEAVPGRAASANVVEGLFLASYIVAAVLAFLVVRDSQSGAPPLGVIPVIVIFAAGLGIFALRRRFPRSTLVLCLALVLVSFAIGSGAEALLVLFALLAEGILSSARRAWIAFGVSAILTIPAAAILAVRVQAMDSLVVTGEFQFTLARFGQDFGNILFIAILLCLVATLIGINAGHRRRLVDSLRERARQMERERDQQASIATANERERIAREMHDVIAHSLSVMIAVADGAQAIAVQRPEESRIAMRRVSETGRKTLGEVRRLLGSVRGDVVEDGSSPQPGMHQLHALADEFRIAGLPVALTVRGTITDDPALGLTIYRIVQESLTNVLRHARAVEEVRVEVHATIPAITITVDDVSAPSVPDQGQGHGRGLVGIRQRAAIYDGVVESGPRDGGGWRVLVRLMIGENA